MPPAKPGLTCQLQDGGKEKMNNAKPEGMRRFNHLLGELDATYHDIALKFGLSDSAMYIPVSYTHLRAHET